VKRDSEGELEYYRLTGEYNHEHFFKRDGQQQRIRKWDEVQEVLLQEKVLNSTCSRAKAEVFNCGLHARPSQRRGGLAGRKRAHRRIEQTISLKYTAT
jgi:hypothetical protein